MTVLKSVSLLVYVIALSFTGCASPAMVAQRSVWTSSSAWQRTLAERLPEYGQNNWIVIADSAYPAQSRVGIETIVTDADQIEVVEKVLSAIDSSKHARPTLYTESELQLIPEADAPGITAYKKDLNTILAGRNATVIPHEQLSVKLDQAEQTYKVLVLKTNMTLPYAPVFVRLDCKYWNADAERRLRDSMQK